MLDEVYPLMFPVRSLQLHDAQHVQGSMRFVVLLCLTACARALPAQSNKPAAEHKTMSQEQAEPEAAPTREPIVAPALSARELIDAAGVATFLEDRELKVAAIDTSAMERWFARPPRSVFVYAERRVEVAEPDETRPAQMNRPQATG